MPKRLIDGDAIATSKTIKLVREEFRIHYPYLLTLALGNGSFECDADLIWQQLYALFIPSITPEKVTEMLDEFEHAKMLFRWKVNGKFWGHWIGQLKSGRLPAPSREEHYKLGAPIPTKKLEKFTGVLVSQRFGKREPAATTGIGSGSGIGSGNGEGLGNGTGVGKGEGSGEGNGSAAPQPPKTNDQRRAQNLYPSTTTTPETNDNDQRQIRPEEQRQDSAAAPQQGKPKYPHTRQIDDLDDDLSFGSQIKPDKVKPEEVRYLVKLLRVLLEDNEHCTEVPTNYDKLWADDFKSMLSKYSIFVIESVVFYSQLPKNQEYYVRSKGVLDSLESLVAQVEEPKNKKVVDAMRTQFGSGRRNKLMNEAKIGM
jgi:hypothetical protein